jgi:hypothetical protein
MTRFLRSLTILGGFAVTLALAALSPAALRRPHAGAS